MIRGFLGRGCLAAGLSLASLAAWGESYVPRSDDEVLETLPRVLLAGRDEVAALQAQLRGDPGNAGLAAVVASRQIDLGNRSGDPRYFGYARATLRPWWGQTDPPADVLQLRAKLKEKDHRYDEALSDLQALLQARPYDVQAWIEVTNLYRVQGRYAEARRACDTLAEFGGAVPLAVSRIPLMALTGQAAEAYDELARLKPRVQADWPGTLPWVLVMQADTARALGRDAQAEQHFKEVLALDSGALHALRGYADFLLDHGREVEALPLLREHIADTGILLRAVTAARRTGEDALATRWAGQLEDRFREIRLRGGAPHGRYEARFVLEFQGDPAQALQFALANWHKQKEHRDSRNVLEAALAVKDPAAAQPVLDFLREHGTQDAVLESLSRALAVP